jgi:hypothetical protein
MAQRSFEFLAESVICKQDSSVGKAAQFYSGGTKFESRSRHRHSYWNILCSFPHSCESVVTSYDRILSSPFSFTVPNHPVVSFDAKSSHQFAQHCQTTYESIKANRKVPMQRPDALYRKTLWPCWSSVLCKSHILVLFVMKPKLVQPLILKLLRTEPTLLPLFRSIYILVGGVAQMIDFTLALRKVLGSILRASSLFTLVLVLSLNKLHFKENFWRWYFSNLSNSIRIFTIYSR